MLSCRGNCIFFLIILLCFLSERHLAKHITVDAGATLMQGAALDLETWDAFRSEAADFSSISLATGSGCTLDGLSIQYVFPSNAFEAEAMHVYVNILNTSVTAARSIATSLRAANLGDIIGINSNQYFLERMCNHPASFLFPNACAAFAPSRLAQLCFPFAPLLHRPAGQSFGALFQDDPFVISTTNQKLLHGELKFALLSGRGSPCRPTGLNLRYVITGDVADLDVSATPERVKVEASASMAKVFTKLSQGDIIGEHSFGDFLLKMCRTTTKQVLPKACDFFSPSHLGMLCKALSPLLSERPEVRDARYRLLEGAPHDEDPFMVRPEKQFAWFAARDPACTPTGLNLEYFFSGGLLALRVIISLEVTTVTASDAFKTILGKARLLDLLGGPQKNVDFREKVCRVEGKSLFPYACDFLAPQHLGGLCPPLAPLLATSVTDFLAWLS